MRPSLPRVKSDAHSCLPPPNIGTHGTISKLHPWCPCAQSTCRREKQTKYCQMSEWNKNAHGRLHQNAKLFSVGGKC